MPKRRCETRPWTAADLQVADPVQAKDRFGFWYRGKVAERRGTDDALELRIRFDGFGAAEDRWHRASDTDTMRDPDSMLKLAVVQHFGDDQHLGDGFYSVEALVSRRRRSNKYQYKVRWSGEYEETWEPESAIADQALIDEYDAKHPRGAAPDAQAPRATLPSLVAAAWASQPLEAQGALASASSWLLADIARETKKVLGKARAPAFNARLFRVSLPAVLFAALHANLLAKASSMRGAHPAFCRTPPAVAPPPSHPRTLSAALSQASKSATSSR